MKKSLLLIALLLLVGCNGNKHLPSNDPYYCTAPTEKIDIEYMGFSGYIKEFKGKKYFVNEYTKNGFHGIIEEDVKLKKGSGESTSEGEVFCFADTSYEKEDLSKPVFVTFKTSIDINYTGKYICPSRYKMEEKVDTIYFGITWFNVFDEMHICRDVYYGPYSESK